MSQPEKQKSAPQDLEALIAQLPVHEQEKLLEQVAEYKAAVEREKCQASFMAFVKKMDGVGRTIRPAWVNYKNLKELE